MSSINCLRKRCRSARMTLERRYCSLSRLLGVCVCVYGVYGCVILVGSDKGSDPGGQLYSTHLI